MKFRVWHKASQRFTTCTISKVRDNERLYCGNKHLTLKGYKKTKTVQEIFDSIRYDKEKIVINNNELFYLNIGEDLVIGLNGQLMYLNSCWDNCHLDFLDQDYIVQESTGLFDKNGVEIFEGDIVNDTYRNEIYKVKKTVTMPVLLLESNQNGCRFMDQDLALNDLEVIGNIFTYEI